MTDWPAGRANGVVYDDEWLRAGTGPLTAEQIVRAAAAAANPFKDTDPTTKAERDEYWRIKNRRIFDSRRVVRGFDINGWQDHVDHMKRTGALEDALALAYECLDAAERAEDGVVDSWPHWVNEVCIILRKMGDHDAEVSQLTAAVERRPENLRLSQRLATAVRLKGRSAAD